LYFSALANGSVLKTTSHHKSKKNTEKKKKKSSKSNSGDAGIEARIHANNFFLDEEGIEENRSLLKEDLEKKKNTLEANLESHDQDEKKKGSESTRTSSFKKDESDDRKKNFKAKKEENDSAPTSNTQTRVNFQTLAKDSETSISKSPKMATIFTKNMVDLGIGDEGQESTSVSKDSQQVNANPQNLKARGK
jgi:hypothetical protein